jgi:hypothetical protein
MSPTSRPSLLIKPTLNTQFTVDMEWWQDPPAPDVDLRRYLLTHLPADQQDESLLADSDAQVWHVNPVTGRATQVDPLGYALLKAADDPYFLDPALSIIDRIFRVFIKNDYTPMTPVQLAEALGEPNPRSILTLLAGKVTYKGIRPVES